MTVFTARQLRRTKGFANPWQIHGSLRCFPTKDEALAWLKSDENNPGRHNEDVRTKGACGHCGGTERESWANDDGSVMIAYALLLVMPVIFLLTLTLVSIDAGVLASSTPRATLAGAALSVVS